MTTRKPEIYITINKEWYSNYYGRSELSLSDIYDILNLIDSLNKLKETTLQIEDATKFRKTDIKFLRSYKNSNDTFNAYKIEITEYHHSHTIYVCIKQNLNISDILTIYKLNPSKFIEYIDLIYKY